MPRTIEVKHTREGDPDIFEVAVREAASESRHRVAMAHETYERLSAGGCAPAAVIEAAFRFLLDREPKESILGSFDITTISRYFPEFEREIPVYLPGPASHG